jgi:hypothetical protein
LDSHLLRHKIYREERKRLVASVSNLKILEPDEVSIPAPSSPSLACITKFSGLRCRVSRCGHLTVSMKRMKLHWKQAHGSLELPIRDSDLARRAILQTFFRGNKVRYFEVESQYTGDTGNSLDQPDHSCTPTEQQLPTPSIETHACLPGLVEESEMCMLRYLHHFTTITSLTLPYSSIPLSGKRC